MKQSHMNKKQFGIFLLTSLPFNFLLCGGLATLIGKQALSEFIGVFTYFEIFSLIVIDTLEGYIKDYNLEKNRD